MSASTPADLAVAKELGYYSIGRAAEFSGVTPKTIRHYESLELIPKAARTAGDYRFTQRQTFLRCVLFDARA